MVCHIFFRISVELKWIYNGSLISIKFRFDPDSLVTTLTISYLRSPGISQEQYRPLCEGPDDPLLGPLLLMSPHWLHILTITVTPSITSPSSSWETLDTTQLVRTSPCPITNTFTTFTRSPGLFTKIQHSLVYSLVYCACARQQWCSLNCCWAGQLCWNELVESEAQQNQ